MKTWKIIIGISILFLLVGTVAAFEVDTLKLPDDYGTLKDGCAGYMNSDHRMFYVESAFGDYKTDWFTNTSDMTVSNVEDNIYSYADNVLEIYGYQEIVELDGDTYMVSINQDSKLSPSEETEFLNDLKEFNELNNLEPIAV